MSHDERHKALFGQLRDQRAGMLVIEGFGQHPQPMTHYAEADSGVLWFITSSDTDLFRAVGADARGQFTLVGDKHRYWAAMDGPVEVSQDDAELDELWSPFAAAWFEGGRDDPKVRLLRMRLRRASVWTATGNPFVFGFEMLKANLKEGEMPDLGEHYVLDFA